MGNRSALAPESNRRQSAVTGCRLWGTHQTGSCGLLGGLISAAPSWHGPLAGRSTPARMAGASAVRHTAALGKQRAERPRCGLDIGSSEHPGHDRNAVGPGVDELPGIGQRNAADSEDRHLDAAFGLLKNP